MLQEFSYPFDISKSYILNAAEKKLTIYTETGLTGSTLPETGITEYVETTFGTVSVYPNPASTSTTLAIDLTNSNENLTVSVYSIVGQKMFFENYNHMSKGLHTLNINTENFANGIYNIVINTGNGFASKKIIINK